jgi:hypothetical protein
LTRVEPLTRHGQLTNYFAKTFGAALEWYSSCNGEILKEAGRIVPAAE